MRSLTVFFFVSCLVPSIFSFRRSPTQVSVHDTLAPSVWMRIGRGFVEFFRVVTPTAVKMVPLFLLWDLRWMYRIVGPGNHVWSTFFVSFFFFIAAGMHLVLFHVDTHAFILAFIRTLPCQHLHTRRPMCGCCGLRSISPLCWRAWSPRCSSSGCCCGALSRPTNRCGRILCGALNSVCLLF